MEGDLNDLQSVKGETSEAEKTEQVGFMRHSIVVTSVLVFVYVAIFVVGIVGNVMVICVLTMMRQMRIASATNLFILNLAFADMSVLIFCVVPNLLASIFVPWLLGSFMCKLVAYVQGVSVCASVYSLVAISLDRFLVIIFPIKMPRGLTPFQARGVIICIWISSFTILFPWLIAFRVVPSGRANEEYCVEDWPESMNSQLYFLIGNLIICYAFPLTVISISNGIIWRHLTHRKIPLDSAAPAAMIRMHKKTRHGVHRMLSVVTLTFLFSWLPLYLIFLRLKFGSPLTEDMDDFLSVIIPFAQWLGVSNSFINPLLYTFLNQKFRDAFRSLISRPKYVQPVQNAVTLTTYCASSSSPHPQEHPIQRRARKDRSPVDHV